ncbi:MAG: hypothetical protein EOO42_23280 [Flavobacteriales bacterium]|nr:MAG: hypothetical protein EOO42_23280 [Flavobacteriales bacterium]
MPYKSFFTLIVALLSFQFSFAQKDKEVIKYDLPSDTKWKVGNDQENDKMRLVEIIPDGETFDNWTIIIGTTTLKTVPKQTMDTIIDLMKQQADQYDNAPQLTVLEKDTTSTNSWALFTLEMGKPKSEKQIESQVYLVVQSEKALYITNVSLKQKTLPADFVGKWSKVLKGHKIVQE